MDKLYIIAKNTFTQTIRQPIYGVLVGCALLLMLISPSISMYSMSDDNKLLRDMGLSTLFLTGLFIAIFAAAGSIAEEMETKTIITVLSKPVPRPVFVLGKFIGIAVSVALAHYVCTLALLMAIRHGVLESAADTHDMTVIAAATAAVGISVILAALFNYWFDWRFSSTVICLLAAFGTVAMVFLCFFNRNWQFKPQENNLHLTDVYGTILLLFACWIVGALALALSSRFTMMVTLACCVGIFLLGLISDYVFGRLSQVHWWANIGRYLVPNLQVFWISDAIYEGTKVPLQYILTAAAYACCYTAGVLAIAVALFQRRQAD